MYLFKKVTFLTFRESWTNSNCFRKLARWYVIILWKHTRTQHAPRLGWNPHYRWTDLIEKGKNPSKMLVLQSKTDFVRLRHKIELCFWQKILIFYAHVLYFQYCDYENWVILLLITATKYFFEWTSLEK